MKQKKERKRYTVAIQIPDKKGYIIAFTGYLMDCIHTINKLIDKHNWPKDKILFIDNETNKIVNIKYHKQRSPDVDFGSIGKEKPVEKKERKVMPWEKYFNERKWEKK